MKLSDERINKHMQLVESYSHYMKLAERYGDKFGDASGATAHWNMIRDDIIAIEREAYRNGLEAMRERAASLCEENAKENSPFKAYENTYKDGWTDAANESGWAIRALPIEEPS